MEAILGSTNISDLINSKRTEGISHDDAKLILKSELVQKILNEEIPFPYHRLFGMSASEAFENLKNYKYNVYYEDRYRIHSYYPQHKLYLPPSFRGNGLIITSDKEDYNNIDVISDLFIEQERLKSIHFDNHLKVGEKQMSPLENWKNVKFARNVIDEIFNVGTITFETLRSAVYHLTPESSSFRPTSAKALIEIVLNNDYENKKWLDISAGWGDRLITAMSLNMEYLGYDPNTNLKDSHDNMIKEFGNSDKQKIKYEPFEKSVLESETFDIVLTSPPYFDVEIYDKDDPNQSINSYPEFNRWMVRFLFVSLIKAWNALKIGGYLVLHVGDSKNVHISEPINLFIETRLKNSSFEGLIGLSGASGYPRPVFVWKKISKTDTIIKWKPFVNRNFSTCYPLLADELHKIYGGLISNNYFKKLDKVKELIKKVHNSISSIDKKSADKVMMDTLLISSLIEEKGFDFAVSFIVNMIGQYSK